MQKDGHDAGRLPRPAAAARCAAEQAAQGVFACDACGHLVTRVSRPGICPYCAAPIPARIPKPRPRGPVAFTNALGTPARAGVGRAGVARAGDPGQLGTLGGDLLATIGAQTAAARAEALGRLAGQDRFVSVWATTRAARAAVERLRERDDWVALRHDLLRWAVRFAWQDAQPRRVNSRRLGRGTFQPEVPRDFAGWADWLRKRVRSYVSRLVCACDRTDAADSLASIRAVARQRRRERDLRLLAALGEEWAAKAKELFDVTKPAQYQRRYRQRQRKTSVQTTR